MRLLKRICIIGTILMIIFCVLKNIGNMTDILNRNGYITTAIHPEYKGNWTRTRVYESFGFDTFLNIDNFESPERIHDSVSDCVSFDKVIEVFESSDCPQFIFNVTMQNHGGYDINKMSGFELVELKETWRGFSDVETYLTLIRESDKAIGQLLEYFRTVDRLVIVCIFGDHQPGVNGVWIEEVMGKTKEQITFEEQQRKYCVPYMIWANYDTKKSPQILNTSTPFFNTSYTKHWLFASLPRCRQSTMPPHRLLPPPCTDTNIRHFVYED